ncbi:hypothetical protein NMYAN_170044 [Nitrosomonas nitrosa]|uniref:Uncharacterized protein n=1 Tax=Nitrosomonas nitrosa TaxID=52442 RepID=A0A8H8YY96_9PROT|nr:hypothetical protein NMYAN_170044 [Nitrosomonas nitrosa]
MPHDPTATAEQINDEPLKTFFTQALGQKI